jgi:hypothetical protein
MCTYGKIFSYEKSPSPQKKNFFFPNKIRSSLKWCQAQYDKNFTLKFIIENYLHKHAQTLIRWNYKVIDSNAKF